MKIADYLSNIHSVAISGHVKPDGDCIGSVLALYNYLKKNYPEIETDAYLEEPDRTFRFLKGFDRINSRFDVEKDYDLMIVLDCSTRERLGKSEKYFAGAGHTICLDHHVSNENFADENFVYGGWSSACEVLYGALDPDRIDKEIAACLYAGIVTDTGVFKYESTTPETMRVVASLMEYGLDTAYIINESFFAKDWNENRILGYALLNSHCEQGGKLIYSCITQEDMKQFHVTTRDLGGIVSQLKLTRGTLCAVFLYENGPHEYKVSFRSDAPVDVNEIATLFGGGGHTRASGCTVTGELETCLEGILTEVRKRLV